VINKSSLLKLDLYNIAKGGFYMFWNVFYKLCEENNTKPNTVAKTIGVSSATCTKWKNGAIPNGDTLLKLADYLGVSVDYLLGRTDEPNGYNINNVDTTVNGTQANAINNISNNNECYDIINALGQLSKTNRLRAIADILDLIDEKYKTA